MAMPSDPDAGLVKRGIVLLIVMLLLVSTVVFIIFQTPRSTPAASVRAEHYAWSVAVPTASFPASVSWGALYRMGSQMPSPVGWEIRQNSWATLARRGSDHVPWTQFREMLDLERATANVSAQDQDSREPPEATARAMVVAALRAVAEWHHKRREMNKTAVPAGLASVYEAVDQLAESGPPEVREQAIKTRETFFRS